MNKQTIIISLAAVVMCSCQSSKVKISGRMVGSDAKTVYLEDVSPMAQNIIDSLTLNADGEYSFTLKGRDATPTLYNIIYNGERIPMFLGGGDNVKINTVGSVVRNYTVEGSDETELLRTFYQPYVQGMQNLNDIALKYASPTITDIERQELARKYTKEYRRIKTEQVRFIVENKASLAAVYALYQRLPGDLYLFNGESDVVYFRTVADALAESYPKSQYLSLLNGEINRIDAQSQLLSKVTESGSPNIEMNDMYGKSRKLHDLDGKVVLLYFWSAEAANCNAINAELKQTYAKYASQGFEVYQVAVDSSKPLWISSVQEQSLPWISVCDFKGQNSSAVSLYNIKKLPSTFLLDKQGNIVAKELYGKALEARVEAELAK